MKENKQKAILSDKTTKITKVRIFMGEEELTSDDIKHYIGISSVVNEIVNRVYYRNKKANPD